MANAAEIDSPALLIYPDRVEENIRRMIRLAGGPGKLRPHIKTHKLPEIVGMHLAQGISKFKAATIAEAEMAASAGGKDILLAYPPVGPKAARLAALARKFPQTRFAAVADSKEGIRQLDAALRGAGVKLDVYLDVDCGMHRTGVAPDENGAGLYRKLCEAASINPAGLHAYDGHLHDPNPSERSAKCDAAFAPVAALRDRLRAENLPAPGIVVSGTPTFPMHARREGVECSPGTCVLWDQGYAAKLPDMDFLFAALVLARVVSKPGENRLCLDLGHKAVASEGPHPRVHFLNLPDAVARMHSEEHLVVETARAGELAIGDCLYGVPWHICPTVALHSQAVVVEQGEARRRWHVAARERMLTV